MSEWIEAELINGWQNLSIKERELFSISTVQFKEDSYGITFRGQCVGGEGPICKIPFWKGGKIKISRFHYYAGKGTGIETLWIDEDGYVTYELLGP